MADGSRGGSRRILSSERSSSASNRRSLPAKTADVAIGDKVHYLTYIDILALFAYSGRMEQLMQVRQAARALGVHENTVRRWEERGLLRAVRLPSGVRRFRTEDVEAMREQMFSGFAPLHEDDDVVPVTRVRSID